MRNGVSDTLMIAIESKKVGFWMKSAEGICEILTGTAAYISYRTDIISGDNV
jgi:hypothetical protein